MKQGKMEIKLVRSYWCVILQWKKGRKCRALRIIEIGTCQLGIYWNIYNINMVWTWG